MSVKVTQHIYSIFFSLVLIFSMNLRGFAAYTDFMIEIENRVSDVLDTDSDEEDSSNYYTSNSSEEENQTSGGYEVLEKINQQQRFNFNCFETEEKNLKVEEFVLDLYDMLKPSLSTPPPEFV